MSQVDVSVIIPTTGTRNGLLNRALASALMQRPTAAEVIIVVDGPELRRMAVANEVRTTVHQAGGATVRVEGTPGGANLGASAARNLGAELSRGGHLAFLDDDDRWKPELFETVFCDGDDFDVALVGFEKHTPGAVLPEKVPPEQLAPEQFFVKNPGLRGSNLLIRRRLYMEMGGFDPRLPAFNDMDFGIRLSSRRFAYRQVPQHLVEFHAHNGPRLSTPGSRANREGLEGFLLRHAPSMGHLQEAAFRRRAKQLWDVDPWDLDRLRRRLDEAEAAGTLAAHFPSLLHAAETVLLERLWNLAEAATEAQELVERICLSYEASPSRPAPPKLRLAVTTTNTPGSIEGLLTSLERELARSNWASSADSQVEVLVVENDTVTSVRDEHRNMIANWSMAGGGCGSRLRIHHLLWEDKRGEKGGRNPWGIARSRAFLMEQVRRLGWRPSPDTPVWLLDEDLRFENLVPDPAMGWRVARVGSILHRLEVLSRTVAADAVVGGNTGAAPVPALGVLMCQAGDLLRQIENTGNMPEQETWSEEVSFIRECPEYYYDYGSEVPEDRRVLGLTAWWREVGDEFPSEQSRLEDSLLRLIQGQPLTRPLGQRLDEVHGSAWGDPSAALVAGGNILLLSEKCLEPARLVDLQWRGGRSRRADSVWTVLSNLSGARVVSMNLPLYHGRRPGVASGTGGKNGAEASEWLTDQLTADVLGVAFYQTVDSRGLLADDRNWWDEFERRFDSRRELVNRCLGVAEAQVSLVMGHLHAARKANGDGAGSPLGIKAGKALLNACRSGVPRLAMLGVSL